MVERILLASGGVKEVRLSNRAAWLWCRKMPKGRKFEAGLRYPTTGKLSLSTQQ